MRVLKPLALFPLLIMCVDMAQARNGGMPSPAEFDPILESAESQLENFEATLKEFRAEAAEINREKLEKDLKGIQQAREMIQAAHSGERNNTVNVQRLVRILNSYEDVTLHALEWKSAAEVSMCENVIQHQDSSRYDQFAARAALNLARLRKVEAELFHTTLRAAGAADKIVLASAEASAKEEKPAH